MSAGQKRAYRLNVISMPEGSEEYGWEPEDWDPGPEPDPPGHRDLDGHWIDGPGNPPFSWPGLRTFLSKSAAEKRAKRFREYGAVVEIEASEPIAWPSDATS